MRAHSYTLIVAATFVCGLSGQTVTVVPSGASLQTAIDAAADGDILLLAANVSDTSLVVDDKSLTIASIAPARAQIAVASGFRVRNLAATRTVTLRHLDFVGNGQGIGLFIHDCQGPVHVEDCSAWSFTFTSGPASGVSGFNDAAVTFTDCQLSGNGGGFVPSAGPGLGFSNANVMLHDCTLVGGALPISPTTVTGPGLTFAASLPGFRLEAVRCSIRSGDGCLPGSPIELTGNAGSTVVLTDVTLAHGTPDPGCTVQSPLVGGNLAPIVRQLGTHTLTVPIRTTPGTLWQASLHGDAGQAVWVAVDAQMRPPLGQLCGSLVEVDPVQSTLYFVGFTDAAGNLAWSLPIPPLPLLGARLAMQGAMFGSTACHLTPLHSVLLLDAQF